MDKSYVFTLYEACLRSLLGRWWARQSAGVREPAITAYGMCDGAHRLLHCSPGHRACSVCSEKVRDGWYIGQSPWTPRTG